MLFLLYLSPSGVGVRIPALPAFRKFGLLRFGCPGISGDSDTIHPAVPSACCSVRFDACTRGWYGPSVGLLAQLVAICLLRLSAPGIPLPSGEKEVSPHLANLMNLFDICTIFREKTDRSPPGNAFMSGWNRRNEVAPDIPPSGVVSYRNGPHEAFFVPACRRVEIRNRKRDRTLAGVRVRICIRPP